MADNRIDFGVGFKVDASGLEKAKASLKEIQNMTTLDLLKKNPNLSAESARKEMQQIKQSAAELEKAFTKAFNPKLGTMNISAFNTEINKSSRSLGLMYKDLSKLGPTGTNAFRGMITSAMTAEAQFKKTETAIDRMGDSLIKTGKWFVSSSVIHNLAGTIQQSVGYVKSLDTSLNNIRIVTGASADEMDRFAKSAQVAAKDLGKSTTDYTNAALIYRQQGLGEEETEQRVRTTLKISNVTGMDATQASEYVTSIANGYQVATENIEEAMDKLAGVAAMSASSLEELATGMSKVASAASSMGVTEDQLVATMSTIISVTRQAPESVGTALKTIYARMGDLKLGKSDEDGIGLGQVSGQLEQLGIHVLDETGNLREMGKVIEETAAKWDTWTEAQRTAAAQAMAGKRQYNNLIALFDNWDKYTAALDASTNSLGELQRQQDIYMESATAHIQKMRTSFEGIYDSLIDADGLKAAADVMTVLASGVEDFIDAIGGGSGAFFLLSSVILKTFDKQLTREISNVATGLLQMGNSADTARQKIAFLKDVESKLRKEGINDAGINDILGIQERAYGYYELMSDAQKEILKNTTEVLQIEHDKKTELEDELEKKKEILKTEQESVALTKAKADLLLGSKNNIGTQTYSDTDADTTKSYSKINTDASIATSKAAYMKSDEYEQARRLYLEAKNAKDIVEKLGSLKGPGTNSFIEAYIQKVIKLNNYLKETRNTEGSLFGIDTLAKAVDNEQGKLDKKLEEKEKNDLVQMANDAMKSVSDDERGFGVDFDTIQGDFNNLSATLDELKQKIKDILNSGNIGEEYKEEINKASSAFEELKNRIEGTSEASEKYNSELEKISNALEEVKAKKPGSQEEWAEVNAEVQKIINSVDKLNQEFTITEQEARETTYSMAEGGSEAQRAVKEIENSLEQVIARIQETKANSQDMFANLNIRAAVDDMVNLFGAVNSVAMGITSLTNIPKVISDENLSGFEKFTQILMSTTMGLPMFISGMNQAISIISKGTIAHTLQAAAIKLGNAEITGNITLSKASIKVLQEKAGVIGLETNMTKQAVAAKIAEAVAENRLSAEKADAALKALGLASATTIEAAATEMLSAALGKASAALSTFLASPAAPVLALVAAFVAITYAVDASVKSLDELKKEIDENNAKISEYDTKISELENELKELNENPMHTTDNAKFEEDKDRIQTEIDLYKGLKTSIEEANNALAQEAYSGEPGKVGILKAFDKIKERWNAFGEGGLSGLFENGFNDFQQEVQEQGVAKSLWNNFTPFGATKKTGGLFTAQRVDNESDLIEKDLQNLEKARQKYEEAKKERDDFVKYGEKDPEYQKTDAYRKQLEYLTEKARKAKFTGEETKVAEDIELLKKRKEAIEENKKLIEDKGYKQGDFEFDENEEALKKVNEQLDNALGLVKEINNETEKTDITKPLSLEQQKALELANKKNTLFGRVDEDGKEKKTSTAEDVYKGLDELVADANYIPEHGLDDTNAKLIELKMIMEDLTDIAPKEKAALEQAINGIDSFQGSKNVIAQIEAIKRVSDDLKLMQAEQDNVIMSQETATKLGITSIEQLEGAREREIISEEAYLKFRQGVADAEANTFGMTSEALAAYTEDMKEVLKANNESIDMEKDLEEEAQELALANARLAKGLKDLATNWDKYKKALDGTDEKAKADAIGEITKNLSAAMNIDEKYLGADFIKENVDTIGKAASGDEEAMSSLNHAAGEEVIRRIIEIDYDEQKDAAIIAKLNGLDEQIKALPDVEVGASIDPKGFVETLNQMLDASEITAAQASAMLNSIGYDPEITYEEVEMSSTMTADSVGQMSSDMAKNGFAAHIEDQVHTKIKIPHINPSGTVKKSLGMGTPAASKGGGGGGSKPKEGKDTNFEDELDLYHKITTAVNKLTASYNKLNKVREKLSGENLKKNLLDQISLQQKILKQEEARTRLMQKERNQQFDIAQNLAKKLGVKKVSVDENGNLNNYDKELGQAQAAINKAVEKYNKTYGKKKELSESQQKKAEKALENIEKLKTTYEKMKAAYDKYDEMGIQLIDQQTKVDEIRDTIASIKTESFEAYIQLHLDKSSIERELNNFIAEVAQGNKYTIALKATAEAGAASKNVSTYQEDYLKNIEGYTKAKNAYDKLNDEKNPNYFDVTYGRDSAKALADMETYMKGAQDSVKGIVDSVDKLKESYLSFLDDTMTKYDDLVEKSEFYNSTLETQNNLIKLLHGENAYDKFSKIYEKQAQNNLATIKIRKQELEKVETLALNIKNKFGEDSEQYAEASKKVLEARQNLNDAAVSATELVVEKYKNTISEIVQSTIDTLSNKNLLADINEQWETFTYKNETFLDTINGKYQQMAYQDAFKTAFDNTDSASAKKALQELYDMDSKHLKALEKEAALSQNEVDYANLRLQLKLKEIALEEAQNNKTKMRLKRDSQGNYRYAYIADDKNKDKAEADYRKAANDYYNRVKSDKINNESTYTSTLEEYKTKITEAATNAEYWDINTQSFTDKGLKYLETLKEEYQTKLVSIVEIDSENVEDLKDAALKNAIAFGEITEEAFNAKTEEEKNQWYDDYIGNLLNNPVSKMIAGLDEASIAKALDETQTDITKKLVTMSEELVDINKEAYNQSVADVSENTELLTGTMDDLDVELTKVNDSFTEGTAILNDYYDTMKKFIDYINNGELNSAISTITDMNNAVNTAKEKDAAANKDVSESTEEYKESGVDLQQDNGKLEVDDIPITDKKLTYYDKTGKGKKKQGTIAKGSQVKIVSVSGDWVKLDDFGWVKKKGAFKKGSFDTGGYTGDWGTSEGRLALLHSKELVLNKYDTENILKAVESMRSIYSSINRASIERMNDMLRMKTKDYYNTINNAKDNGTIEQNVHIEAHFEGQTEAHQIEMALSNLVNVASQHAWQK